MAINSVARVTVLLGCLLSLSGCVGFMVTEIAEAMASGKKHSEVVATTPPPPTGQGRLLVYRTSASTRYGLMFNYGVTKNDLYCTINDRVYHFVTESYVQADLATGQHEVSCGGVFYPKGFMKGFGFKKGTEVISAPIHAGRNTYVRVDLIDRKETPVLVSEPDAVAEIGNSRVMVEENHIYLE